MPFNIIRDNITNLKTDAIVNAANERLLAGGGVCGAIFSAAGREKLQKECNKIGYCKTGNAVITKGYDLKAKYIIHTVGPLYGANPKNEEKELYSCYKNSLELAKKKKLSSIAFPLISSGIFGYPKNEAIKVATRAIKDFLLHNEMNVYLVVYDKKSFEISEELFQKVESYIDEKLVVPECINRRIFEQSVYIDRSGFKERSTVAEDCNEERLSNMSCEPLQETSSFPCIGEKEVVSDLAYRDIKTASLPKTISKKRSLSELLSRKAETFSELLFKMIDEKGMSDVEVYKRANIDRKLFSKMRKKDYIPKKQTVMALIISLKLNMQEAKELLERAGYAFSKSSKFDIIISYFIESGVYDIFEINETLFAFEEQCLGA